MKYDQDKFRRLRDRRAVLFNERYLAGKDGRDHHQIVRTCKARLQELEKRGEPPVYINLDGGKSQPGGSALKIARSELKAAEKLLALATKRQEEIEEQAESMGSLVLRLEDAVKQWGLKLPPESRLNSPGTRRAGERA